MTSAPAFPARRWQVLLGAAIVLAIAVRTWAATQWISNFQSDEAVFGLMARHILAGEFTPTLYGPAYLGSIESIISAGFMSLLGPSVMAFRMSTLLLFGAFFVLHAIFASRYFGYPTALVSLLFLALPGFHVLEWTYQPVGAYGAIFVIGTLLFLVGLRELSDGRTRAIRAAIMGVLAGLGMWANSTTILYLAVIGLVAFLGSPEWRMVHRRLAEFADRVVLIPLSEWLPVAVIGAAGVGVLTFFSSACRPEGLYLTIGSIARMILVLLCVGLAAWGFILSRRRLQLGVETGALAIGVAAGYSPLLYPWIANGIPPYWAVYPSCPEGAAVRAKLLAKEILPAMGGIPTVEQLRAMAGTALVAWLAVLGLTVAAIALFLWWNRVTAWRIFGLSPLEPHERPLGVILLLFAVPNLVSTLAGNTVDLYSIRHTLMTVQACAIIFAVFVVWLTTRLHRIGVIVAAFWLLFVGISSLAYANAHWLVKFTRYEPTRTAELAQYLRDNDIEYAYADYWGAYTLDYLLEEQVIIAPFNGIDRYLPYSDAVAAATRLAYIFPASNAPLPTGETEDLRVFLDDRSNPRGEGRARAAIRRRLADQSVIETQSIGDWSVWIVSGPPPSADLGSNTSLLPDALRGS